MRARLRKIRIEGSSARFIGSMAAVDQGSSRMSPTGCQALHSENKHNRRAAWDREDSERQRSNESGIRAWPRQLARRDET
jgi:hypothetical protein